MKIRKKVYSFYIHMKTKEGLYNNSNSNVMLGSNMYSETVENKIILLIIKNSKKNTNNLTYTIIPFEIIV